MSGFRPLSRRIAACSLLGLLAACQQESPTAPTAEQKPGYDAEMRALKASAVPDIDARIVELQVKYGLRAAGALPKAAGTTFNLSLNKPFMVTVKGNAGYPFYVSATPPTGSTVDPMIFIIQFNDLGFRQTGLLDTVKQNPFQVLAWNDDYNGSRTANVSFTPATNEYFMYLVVPFSSSTRGNVNLSVYNSAYPGYPYTATIALEGEINRTAGNDFVASGSANGTPASDPNYSDPFVYVFKAPSKAGCGNVHQYKPLLKRFQSEVYNPPFSLSSADVSGSFYNFALVGEFDQWPAPRPVQFTVSTR